MEIQSQLNAAIDFYKSGNYPEAKELFLGVLNHKDVDKAGIYSNLSVVSLANKETLEAIEFANQAIELNSHFAEAHYNLAKALVANSELQNAKEHYLKAVKLAPNYTDAYFNLANLLYDMEEFAEANIYYKIATEHDSKNANYLTNYAISLSKTGDIDSAFRQFATAIELEPNSKSLWLNAAIILHEYNEFEQSKSCFINALNIDPNYAEARWSYALLLLKLKHFDEGWKLYEERFNNDLREHLQVKHYRRPRIEKITTDATIFVDYEQGFGDTIMFCRFLPELAKECKKVYFKPQHELCRLMKNSKLISEYITITEEEPDEYDGYTTLCSLPYLLQMDNQNVPLSGSFLEPEKSGKFDFIKDNKNFKVGLVWQGSKHIARLDKKRSVKLSDFSKLFELSNLSFYSLQKGFGVEQIEQNGLEKNIITIDDKLGDFNDTAEAISHLDLVITVDTSVAHISASLGKPTWILIDAFNCFRWSHSTESSYWYDSVRLFRQSNHGNWDEVFERVKIELEKF